MTAPQFNTTAEIFTPNKCRRAKVRGMRPVLDYAERRGVERVESWPLAPMDDAPVRVSGQTGWLLDHVGNRFMALVYVDDAAAVDPAQFENFSRLAKSGIPVDTVLVSARAGQADLPVFEDYAGRFAERYDARSGSVYLIRPDQHVAARWREFDADRLRAALARATCNA